MVRVELIEGVRQFIVVFFRGLVLQDYMFSFESIMVDDVEGDSLASLSCEGAVRFCVVDAVGLDFAWRHFRMVF
jgi:hypothetical protein